jgi:hypothetical protein
MSPGKRPRRGLPAVAPAKRACLGLVGAGHAEIGIWGLLAPHSFFNDFPGAGHHWVSALGPYNEHMAFLAATLPISPIT